MDRGHTGEGYGDLSKMTYTPGELNYRGHMAIMVRDVAMSQRAHADGLAAKGIKVPVLDMMDEKTRVNWAKRRKKDF